MHLLRTLLVTATCFVSFGPDAGGSILSDALLSFPAKTDYVEVDNLAALRTLSYYRTLRGRFAGESLQDLQTVLLQLGITEAQVEEIAIGSNGNATYGLAAGTFSSKDPAVKARLRFYATKLLETEMYCVGRATCVSFLEDWMVAFGTPESLRSIRLARQGVLTALNGNGEAVRLFETADKTAPVRGVLFGADLQAALSDTLQQWFGKLVQSFQLPPGIDGLAYNVTFGTTVHLQAIVQCSSRSVAAVLAQTINTLSMLQSMTKPASNKDSLLAFEQAKASSDDREIHLEADARGFVPIRK